MQYGPGTGGAIGTEALPGACAGPGRARPPFRLILPSCESGLLAPAGADELLGLASALLPLGTAGIVASVAQVNDRAAAALMLALHRRLRSADPGARVPPPPRCATPADACQASAGDPVVTAAGWSFSQITG